MLENKNLYCYWNSCSRHDCSMQFLFVPTQETGMNPKTLLPDCSCHLWPILCETKCRDLEQEGRWAKQWIVRLGKGVATGKGWKEREGFCGGRPPSFTRHCSWEDSEEETCQKSGVCLACDLLYVREVWPGGCVRGEAFFADLPFFVCLLGQSGYILFTEILLGLGVWTLDWSNPN